LGGGAGIVVDCSYCTLATIGHDHVGDLVGFTAGHCAGPGAQVVAEGSGVPVGTPIVDFFLNYTGSAAAVPTDDFGLSSLLADLSGLGL